MRGTTWMGINTEGAKKRTTAPKKTKTSKQKWMYQGHLHSKRIKHETSQKNDQEKLRQGKRTNRKQNNGIEPSTKATKTETRAQEVTEIEEVAPPTTCIKARNANMYSLP